MRSLLLVVLCAFLGGCQGVSTITISNVIDLQKIGNDPAYPMNGEYALTQDIDASATLAWNGGAGVAPIGAATETPFTGAFNGNGHVISGLHIDHSNAAVASLFAALDGPGRITRLGVTGGSITGAIVVSPLVGVAGGNTAGWSIADCYTNVPVAADSLASGLVAMCGPHAGTVSHCYSVGAVTSAGTKGGLCGANIAGTFTACYWDTQTSGQSTSAGGTGKTTAEMKTQSTFTGWDFFTVWQISSGEYPTLRTAASIINADSTAVRVGIHPPPAEAGTLIVAGQWYPSIVDTMSDHKVTQFKELLIKAALVSVANAYSAPDVISQAEAAFEKELRPYRITETQQSMHEFMRNGKFSIGG